MIKLYTLALSLLLINCFSAIGQDASIYSHNIPRFLGANTNHAVQFLLTNNAGVAITSYRMVMRVNGGSPVGWNYNTNLPEGYVTATQNLNHNLNLPNTGEHTVELWVTNVNSSTTPADPNPGNDTIRLTVIAVGPDAPARRALFEGITGTWCGYCPNGSTAKQTTKNTTPQASYVTVHTGDLLTDSRSRQAVVAYSGGSISTPKALINRSGALNSGSKFSSSSTWNNLVRSGSSVSIASMDMESNYIASTRQVTVTLRSRFNVALEGSYRFNCYIKEDIIGTGNIAQRNFMNDEPSSPFHMLGDPIEGYEHKDVARHLLGDSAGTSGIIPNTPTVGTEYTHTYTYTLPAGWDASKIMLVGFVWNGQGTMANHEVLNSQTIALHQPASRTHASAIGKVTYGPVPVTHTLNLMLNAAQAGMLNMEVTSVTGQRVYQSTYNVFAPGNHTLEIPSAAWAPGVYVVTLSQNGNRQSLKVLK